MATLDLTAPGASPTAVTFALAAAGEVIRSSGLSPDVIRAGVSCVAEHRAGRVVLAEDSWHWRALQVFEDAQRAALQACFGHDFPPGSALLIVDSKGPASYLL